MDERSLLALAREAGVSEEAAMRALAGATLDKVQRDLDGGRRSGVQGSRPSSSTVASTRASGGAGPWPRHSSPEQVDVAKDQGASSEDGVDRPPARTRRGRIGDLRLEAVVAALLTTTAGGAMDAWVYFAHGHVFANAQTGNVVLMAVALSSGNVGSAADHLPSLIAFVAGLLASRFAGSALKRTKWNSRNVRLGAECVLLMTLGLTADHLRDQVVTACVGFVAGVQITSLSHIGGWSFNTGMTTGNLRSAATAFVKAVTGSREEWPHALVMTLMCAAFAAGALLGAWLTPRLGSGTVWIIAALVAAAIAVAPRDLDPLPRWQDLE